jgi:cytochrome b6-f complex iron-sulfur subunit
MEGEGHGNEPRRHDDAFRQGTSRREVVNWILGLGAGGVAAAVFYPIVRYIVPPEEAQSAANSVALSVKPEDVKPNSGQIFKFGNKPAILIRTPSGELRAFSAVCTHLGCIVEYRADLSEIWCPCHNGHYDLHGINIAGPPPKPLQEFTVNVSGERIVVGRGQPA